MKKALLLVVMLAVSILTHAQGQRSRKLSPEDASKKTMDQRFVYESERKSKGKKKNLSVKKKVRIEEKQHKKSRKIKAPKRPN